MATVTVRLVLCGWQIELPRVKLLDMFPESILSQAIKSEPDVTTIDLNTPDVTVHTLDILKMILENSSILSGLDLAKRIEMARDIILDGDLRRAGNYLNIDVLNVMVDNQYPILMNEHPEVNLLNQDSLSHPEIYQTVLNFSVSNHSSVLVWYLFRAVPERKDEHIPIEEQAFVDAIERHEPEIVTYLMKRGINPSIRNNIAIREATSKGSLRLTCLLLAHPDVDITVLEQAPLRMAAANGCQYVVERLLEEKKVDPTAKNHYALISAVQFDHVAVVDLLLKDGRVDPSFNGNDALKRTIQNNRIEKKYAPLQSPMIQRLLNDPKTNLGADDDSLFHWAGTYGYVPLILYLLKNPQVNPLSRGCQALTMARQHGWSDAVKILLDDPRIRDFDRDEVTNFLQQPGPYLAQARGWTQE